MFFFALQLSRITLIGPKKCALNGFQSEEQRLDAILTYPRFPTTKCGTTIDIGYLFFWLSSRSWDEQISNNKETYSHPRSGGLAYRLIPP